MLRNFIEFLYIFGHFVRTFIASYIVLLNSLIHSWQAGEDLEEDEDDSTLLARDHEAAEGSSETEPLLSESVMSKRSLSRARRAARRNNVESHGDATVTQAVLMVSYLYVILSEFVI